MTDLLDFLRARLDEDAEKTEAARDGGSGEWFVGDGWNVYRAEDEDPNGDAEENRLVVHGNVKPQSEHIAAYDPKRTLAEVKAKREFLRIAEQAADYPATFTSGFAAAMEQVARMFAAPYADHPDYRQEWTP